MASAETIVALASGAGSGAQAIIRLSGPACQQIAQQMEPADTGPRVTDGSTSAPAAPIARSVHLHLDRTRHLSPRVLAMISHAPRSYTGEDTIELLIPAGPALVARVIEYLLAFPGVRLAQPGEFSARAFLAGKLSLAHAEGIAATIAARTQDELQTARSLTDGSAGTRYTIIADRLATLLALVESGIDFADTEGVVAIAPADLHAALSELLTDLTSITGSIDRRVPVIALTGPPNAGKSTLFNALLGTRRALVSGIRGTTRDAISEPIRLFAPGRTPIAATLVDLAGLDNALNSPTDIDAQHRAREIIRSADIVLACDPDGQFADLAEVDTRGQILRIRTKCDRPAAAQPAPAEHVSVCALTGSGIAGLRDVVASRLTDGWQGGLGRSLLPHHRQALSACAASVGSAREVLSETHDPALVAGMLRTALDDLAPLTGELSPDAILGRVFSTFCIGK